ncbi:P-loop NTPase family protein [Jiangella rhizosphaerae]|uniref:hypothetical protein n=1 Tax=Jiangella rhizosphaerae TaxID=2293569 RepID=UPI0011C49773|nr:hypothetical protein [Jiangella rhizosphaerae]
MILVEADVSGSSSIKAGHFRGQATPSPNIMDLADAHHNHRSLGVEALRHASLPLPLEPSRRYVAGIARSDQLRALTPDFWDQLASVLANTAEQGYDVIVDAGRIRSINGPDRLLERADMVAVVMRNHLDHIVSAASNADYLRRGADAASNRVGAILLGQGPYPNKKITEATGLRIWSTLAWDPHTAGRLMGDADLPTFAKFERTGLYRSARSTVNELRNIDAERRSFLGTPQRTR